MQKNSEDFSVQEALRLAQSPAGQQLLAALRQQNSGQLQQVLEQFSAGDLKQAGKAVDALRSDPQIQRLLEQLGR